MRFSSIAAPEIGQDEQASNQCEHVYAAPTKKVVGGVVWRLDTEACNRPNHCSCAPTAPTLAGASRCHKQIIHAVRLDLPSPAFM